MDFINSRTIFDLLKKMSSHLWFTHLEIFPRHAKKSNPTYGSRGNSFDPCKTNYTHFKSKRKIFQNWKSNEQFIPWNTNPCKHIIHANQEAKTPGSTFLKWLQYAQRFSNFTMIFLFKNRQLQLFEKEISFIKKLPCKVWFITWNQNN